MKLIGRNVELNKIARGFSSSGNLRAGLIHGDQGIGKSLLLEEVGNRLIRTEPEYFWLAPQALTQLSPAGWCAQLARGMRAGESIPENRLHEFALEMGKKLAILPHTEVEPKPPGGGKEEEISNVLLENLETLVKGLNLTHACPMFALDDLDQYPDALLNWIAGPLNQALRKSKFFQKSRFLFTAQSNDHRLQTFFNRFGIEHLNEFELSGLSAHESGELFFSVTKQKKDTGELYKATRGNPAKILNFSTKRSNFNQPTENKMETRSDVTSKNNTPFDESQLKSLFCAAYPNRINRYNLEFFCTPREAAFCFNWLKRSPELANLESDGDLTLVADLRMQILELHKERDPGEAEERRIKSIILNTFVDLFPNPNLHWVPINLQLFNCFTRKLCRELFDENSYEEIDFFLDQHADQFIVNDKQIRLSDEAKLITTRFIEIGGGLPREGLLEQIKQKWEEDQTSAKQKKVAMEQEHLNLLVEEEDSKKQIKSLDALKKKLLDDFKNPATFKKEKIYSVSSSPVLIVLGLVTVGASLFFDSIGTYYAGGGLVLTLFGFFWPNVDVRKPRIGPAGSGPRLAIETQQRSLDHRIVGLKNRISSMSGSLERLSSELDGLNAGISEPYVLED